MTSKSYWLSLLISLSLSLLVLPAHGLPPPTDSDDDPRGPVLARQDTVPHELFHEEKAGAPFWISIDASIGHTRDKPLAFGAMLLLGLPLEGFARPLPKIATGPRRPRDEDPRPAASPKAEPERSERALPPPPPPGLPVSPAVARAAVSAALKRARLIDPDAPIDAIASRARIAALLPELRLRASRSVDEGQTLSPTEYDPARVTASGGTSLWLEARATWRLDRLVFADDEVALERAKSQRAEAQAKLIERVLNLLFAWQRGLIRENDDAASDEEHLAATLKKIEAEIELDVLTSGWFTRWRAARGEGGNLRERPSKE